ARFRKTRIYWTVHKLRRHERDYPLLEPLFWRIFLPNVDGLICKSHSSRQLLYDQHPRTKKQPVFVIPPGHYRGFYPDAMSNDEARCALGLAPDEFVITFIGQVRPYKGVSRLIRCFKASGLATARLLIAGRPSTGSIVQELNELADGSPSIRLFLDFVADAD